MPLLPHRSVQDTSILPAAGSQSHSAAAYRSQTSPVINNVILGGIISKKKSALVGSNATAIQAQIDYIKSKTDGGKGF